MKTTLTKAKENMYRPHIDMKELERLEGAINFCEYKGWVNPAIELREYREALTEGLELTEAEEKHYKFLVHYYTEVLQ